MDNANSRSIVPVTAQLYILSFIIQVASCVLQASAFTNKHQNKGNDNDWTLLKLFS